MGFHYCATKINDRIHGFRALSLGERENGGPAHSKAVIPVTVWLTAKAAEGRRTPGRCRAVRVRTA